MKKPSLNERQKKAVETVIGPVLVLAGAGTGKTRVVTERIAHILRRGHAKPPEIIAVTFTNKAAAEMRERLIKLVGKASNINGLIVSTFHSLCVRILRRDADLLGYRKNFSICDTGEQLSLIRKSMRTVNGVGNIKPDILLSQISSAKGDGVSPEAFRRSSVDERDAAVAQVYRKYQSGLKRLNAMDFDDLMVKAVELLRRDEQVLSYWQDRARFCLVDEFQDTNDIQYDFLRLLSGRHGNLCVVGDDDQSIYSWRGAKPKHIVNFSQTFPKATVVRLEENYRSVNTVLKAANAVIENNDGRVGKTLWSGKGEGDPIYVIEAEDPQEESERVVARIQRSIRDGVKENQHAILLRTNAQTRPVEEELRAQRVRYTVIGGQSFFDHKEVRDVMAYLSVVNNPDDDNAMLRIINVPARSLGGKSVEAISEYALTHKMPIAQALEHADKIPGLQKASVASAKSLAGTFAKARKFAEAGEIDKMIPRLLDEVDYRREVEHLYDDPFDVSTRINNAYEVADTYEQFSVRNPESDLSAFLQEMMLSGREESNDKEKELAKNAVKIITLHSAKGLEFPHVYLMGMNDGTLPHQNSIDTGDISEERRLAYVGITRAQKKLTLSYSKGRTVRGKHQPLKVSRFMLEIPDELLDRNNDKQSKEDQIRSHIANAWAALE